MKRSPCAAVLFGAALLRASPDSAGITPENAFEFLEMGDVSYSINVAPETIEWDVVVDRHGSPILPQVRALERRVPEQGVAGPLPAALLADLLALLELYWQSDEAGKGRELAARYLPALRMERATNGSERVARAYALALFLRGSETEYPEAYETLRPHLEGGRADLETCLLAVDLCMALRDHGLARKVADAYVPRYPGSAELLYSAFTTSLNDSVYGSVSRLFQSRAAAFLKKTGSDAFTRESLSEFVRTSLAGMYAEIDFRSLERAAALEPSSYKYALATATFKSVARFLSVLYAAGLSRQVDAGLDIAALMAAADEKGLAEIGAYLDRALAARPSRDIQAYLALALFHAVSGRGDELRRAAQQATALRPDLAAGYDALIFAAFFPLLRGRDIDLEMTRTALEILERKTAHVGGSPLDSYAMAGFRFTRYGMSATEADRRNELTAMKAHLDRALEMDTENLRARVGVGVYRVLAGDHGRAISVFDAVLDDAQDNDRLYALQNRGVARILVGDRAAGIADLRAALGLRSDNPKTVRALAAVE